jgi:hypothetical protein
MLHSTSTAGKAAVTPTVSSDSRLPLGHWKAERELLIVAEVTLQQGDVGRASLAED